MNANDVGMKGESSSSDNQDATDCLGNSPKPNDYNKHCVGAVGGARPKNRVLGNLLTNGISNHTDEAVAVNNNIPLDAEEEATSSKADYAGIAVNKVLNGLNSNRSNGQVASVALDTFLSSSNDNSLPMCSFRLKNGSNKVAVHNGRRDGVLNKVWNDDDGSSSDTGNDGDDALSADECCFYTYKGDQVADLPSSFFRFDIVGSGDHCAGENSPRNRRNVEDNENVPNHSGSSSPEMDFLEMDFDPGPSCDQNSDEESEVCVAIEDEHCREVVAEFDTCELPDDPECEVEATNQCVCDESDLVRPSTSSAGVQSPKSISPEEPYSTEMPGMSSNSSLTTSTSLPQILPHSRSADMISSNNPATVCWPPRDAWGHHCSGADLCSLGNDSCYECTLDTSVFWNSCNAQEMRKYNLHASLYHSIMAKRLLLSSHDNQDNDTGKKHNDKKFSERVMIWSEKEACAKHVTQIGTSQCGATAVLNVLTAFNMSASLDKVKECVRTRLRAEGAPLPEYLVSRSVAGATHEDIIRGVVHVSDDTLYARFIPFYPEGVPSLTKWLANWMKKGAVPVATLNLQKGSAPGGPIPDAWHHQMIFGVGPLGVYLTNPLECVSEAALWPQLCSPSILLVRRSDVLARWDEATDLRPLANHPDPSWKEMNVLGQVVNVIRESVASRNQIHGRTVTSHISIPASYHSGITLVMRRESPYYEELKNSPPSFFYH